MKLSTRKQLMIDASKEIFRLRKLAGLNEVVKKGNMRKYSDSESKQISDVIYKMAGDIDAGEDNGLIFFTIKSLEKLKEDIVEMDSQGGIWDMTPADDWDDMTGNLKLSVQDIKKIQNSCAKVSKLVGELNKQMNLLKTKLGQ